MTNQFCNRSPKAATALIYIVGYLAGSLIAALLAYLISGVVKPAAIIAFGTGCGTIALAVAQHRNLIPRPDELNRPISLFGPGGYREEPRK